MRFALLFIPLGFLALGGCAQSPQEIARVSHGKEYFPSSVYGPASRRVIADGQPIPRGGGQYLVGKPYSVAGQRYVPSERKITEVGLASWYGDAFHGRLTANGEIYDRNSFSAAHPTMPLPSYARVTNLANNYSMVVRVNDRGPFHPNRIMDVSKRVAEALNFARSGTSNIRVDYIGRASLAGSDDEKLLATLHTEPSTPRTMVAANPPPRERTARIEHAGPGNRVARRDVDGDGDTVPERANELSVKRFGHKSDQKARLHAAPTAADEHAPLPPMRLNVAKRDAGRDGRTFASHELAPRLERRSFAELAASPRKTMARQNAEPPAAAMPARRPVHLAAAWPEHHDGKAVSHRANHERDD